MAGQSKIGIRYAQALAGLAGERNEVSAVYADMKSFLAAYKESDELRSMLKSPVIKFDKKIAVLKALFGSLNSLTQLFFDKIVKEKREKYLGDIAQAYISQIDASNGILTVQVKSAAPLSAENRTKIQELAKGNLANNVKEVRFEETISPELLGGFIVTVGDRQIDTSFAHKLKELERSFNENIYVKNF